MINECEDPKLNDCDENATCMDNDLSFECLCREGFIDASPKPREKPGIKCQKREFQRRTASSSLPESLSSRYVLV